jgi:DNA-binding MarR family transcriptional regulator
MNLPVSQARGFAELGRALGRLTEFRDSLDAAGVTPLEYQAMLLVKTSPHEQIALGVLARRLNLPQSFCVRLAEKLAENAFAVSRPSARVSETVLQLSPHGEEILAAFAARHLEALRCAEHILGETASRPPRCQT